MNGRSVLLALALTVAAALVPDGAEARARSGASARMAKKRARTEKRGKGKRRKNTKARRIQAMDRERVPADGLLRVRGRVTGRGDGKPVTAAIYRDYPRRLDGDGEPPVLAAKADGDGRFSIDGCKPGRYWVAAFVDANGDGRWQAARELGGLAAPTNPVEVDEVRDFITVELELDPLYVELRTRFVPGSPDTPARHVYEGVAVSVAGAGLLPEKTAQVSTPSGPAQPGSDVAGRYFVELQHPGLGAHPVRRMILPTAFGAAPVFVSPPDGARLPAGQDVEVSWKMPAWGNDARLVVRGADDRPVWAATGPSPLVIPARVLRPGARYRAQLEAARVYVQGGGIVARSSGASERAFELGAAAAGARPDGGAALTGGAP